MENKPTVSQIAIRYGLILGLILIIISIIFEFLNLEFKTQQNLNYGSFIFVLAAIILAHKAFKEGGDGFMSLGQGIGIGTLLSVISGVISGIFTYVYLKFIDDSMLQEIKDLQIEGMEKQGMSDAQIEQAMEYAGAQTIAAISIGACTGWHRSLWLQILPS